MSLFSAHTGIVVGAAPSAQTTVDDFYGKWTVVAALFLVMHEIGVLVFAGWPPDFGPWLDHENFLFGRDFLNTWLGGWSVYHGGPAPWFDYHVYNEVIRQTLGVPYPTTYWSYPPHILLFTWPFGLMPYYPAYIAWSVIGIALYLYACSAAVARERLLFLAVAPGIAICVFFGQNGFYTSALLIGGMLNRERNPVLAGILFGILTIKPQLGFLLPVVLVLERRWTTIASALITTAVLVVLTAMLFGWNVWTEYLHKILPQQAWLTETSNGLLFGMVASVFYAGRLWDFPLNVDWAMQWCVSALAFGAVVWTYWKPRDPALSFALFVTATFLFTPYILNYDMVVFGFVIALLRDRRDITMRDHWLLLIVWTLPVTMMLTVIVWIPLAPLVLIAFAIWLMCLLVLSDGHPVRPLLGRAETVSG
jgi:hypothetical protein